MSILIKGMEMPKTCNDCGLRDSFDCWITCSYIEARFSKRNDDCPLVDIPTPHGRLIDIKSVEDGKFVTVGNDLQRWWNGALESIIDNAPTVIEAEGETDA